MAAPQPVAKVTRVPRERKPPTPIHERMKNQLTTAALRGRIEVEALEELEGHIVKLKGLLA